MLERPLVFSVIVPTYNRLSLLSKTLESLFRQDFPSYEIIVINDGSTDGTSEYLSSLAEKKKIKYIHGVNRGPALARNAGIREARGVYIAFTDDDCVVPSDWLQLYYERFQRNGVAGIGGTSQTGNTDNPFAEVNDLIVNFLKSRINTVIDCRMPFLTSNNAAYKRASLEKVGGFESFFRIGAEERDLNYRLVQAGEKLLYDPSIVVNHYNDADFKSFLRHQFDQGRGSYLFYQNARLKFGKRPPMIPMEIYIRLFVYPFTVKPFTHALLFSILIFLAQIAVTLGYITASRSGLQALKSVKIH